MDRDDNQVRDGNGLPAYFVNVKHDFSENNSKFLLGFLQ